MKYSKIRAIMPYKVIQGYRCRLKFIGVLSCTWDLCLLRVCWVWERWCSLVFCWGFWVTRWKSSFKVNFKSGWSFVQKISSVVYAGLQVGVSPLFFNFYYYCRLLSATSTLSSRIRLPVRTMLILHIFHLHFLTSLLIDLLCTRAVLFFCLSSLWWHCAYHPGHTNFAVCTLSISSILHPLHSVALSDLIVSHHPDLSRLTENWVKNSTTSSELTHCTSPNYTFVSTPCISFEVISSAVRGGTGFLIREPFTQLLTFMPSFPHLNSPQLLWSCLSLKSLSSSSIVHPHCLPSLNIVSFPWRIYLLSFCRYHHSSWICNHWWL